MGSGNIVQCVIHPGIGIARVGNSPTEYFIGAETPSNPPSPPDGLFKDAEGRIKRQVAKFRIYGLDSDGKVVKQLTTADADITWTVHVANKKAIWYDFEMAMDIPTSEPTTLRNAKYAGDRLDLVIDPGPRVVSGKHAQAAFDTGKFLGATVPLGEIRTDDAGNLLVFGGFGASASPTNKPITGFNNIEWYDDISDGSVSATVTIDNQPIPVTSAWVIVAPPDYAPGIKSIVTMYDIAYQVAIEQQWLKPPAELSFTENIYPIFERFNNLQWVNNGFYLDFGWGSPGDFLSPEMLARLADNSPAQQPFRQAIFKAFRNPDYATAQPDALPPFYGDGVASLPLNDNPRNWLAVTQLQYDWLGRWAAGEFIPGFDPKLVEPRTLEELPLADQPHALDKAALDFCLGGAFHPGCEATWPMRHASLYAAPFRIKQIEQEKLFGPVLTPEVAVSPEGPIGGSTPGDITRWMVLPWQVDTASCGAGYQPDINPFFPTFWPARVPNQVLPEDHYKQSLDAKNSQTQQLKQFSLRLDWLRDLVTQGGQFARINQFLTDWSKVGIVTRREVEPGHALLPPVVHVELQNSLEEHPDDRFDNINPLEYR
ncbi:MAG: LodA/GoxA family CTQ-dependent oxidase [Acidobacteriota bacterium]|nr:LodA/GoxA family CTQ-dependent oxidase [Acidobacteriota bacterium]